MDKSNDLVVRRASADRLNGLIRERMGGAAVTAESRLNGWEIRGLSLAERLDRRSIPEPNSGCVLWLGSLEKGYGRTSVNGGMVWAHRLAYEVFVGPIPVGLFLDHLCRNPGCINPAHLEPVTNGENVRRGQSDSAVNARKTSCYRGHPFSAENTHINPDGARVCRTCRLAYKRLQNRKRKEQRHAL